MRSPSFPSLLAAASLALAAPTPQNEPIPPSQDPWYTSTLSPSALQNALPGEILRIRQAAGNLTQVVANCSAAYNILYRSTNSLYEASWDVTTLFISSVAPDSTTNKSSDALLSYQIPYNTADVDGSPSYSLYAPPTSFGGVNPTSDISTVLSLGWNVNVPDFEGPLAAFAAGIQEGHATLDSIRASLHAGLGLSDQAKVAMWGYSGGSIASEWASELAEQYAPELTISGAALGGLVTNGTDALEKAVGTIWAGLAPEGILGLTVQHPEAREYLLSQLHDDGPYNSTYFLAANNLTINEAFSYYSGTDTWSFFTSGRDFFGAPLIKNIVDRETIMGYHGVPRFPLFIYKAVADELASTSLSDELVERYCQVGANIVFERNTIGGHLAEETNGDARAVAWLQSVFAGTYNHTGCTVRNVAVNITDSSL